MLRLLTPHTNLLASAALAFALAAAPFPALADFNTGLSGLDLGKIDPDRQLPSATEDIAEGTCRANQVIVRAIGGDPEAAAKELDEAIERFGSAADELNGLAEGPTFDGLPIDPQTPGLGQTRDLFVGEPQEIDDILKALALRAANARDAAGRIRSDQERPEDLMALMTASSEITLLLALLGEALSLAV